MPLIPMMLSFLGNPVVRKFLLIIAAIMAVAALYFGVVGTIHHLENKVSTLTSQNADLKTAVDVRDTRIAVMAADAADTQQRQQAINDQLQTLTDKLSSSQAERQRTVGTLVVKPTRKSTGEVDTQSLETNVNKGFNDFFTGVAKKSEVSSAK